MTNIFTLENFQDFSEKINIDDLYENKRKSDLNELELFKKILNRVHVKIKTISRHSKNDKFCWYVVPEIIIGIPKYDQAACIAYLLDTLHSNGFRVKYIHPNTLFISWSHWIPSYVRNEIKKRTGITINEFGEKVEDNNNDENEDEYNEIKEEENVKNNTKYNSISSYKPMGNLVYNEEYITKIDNKFNNYDD